MVRSAAALLAVIILAGFSLVQQAATHTVVSGDTLWDLAQRYYQNPFDWRRIWEANRAQVADPNVIEPGWVLTIPGRDGAQVSDVTVEAPPSGPSAPAASGGLRDVRTIFYQDTTVMRAGVVRSEASSFLSVPRDMVLGAPWLIPVGQEPESLGVLDGFAGGADLSETPRAYDRVHLVFPGGAPAAGTLLLAYRPDRIIEGVGRVAIPTGIVTVSEVEGSDGLAVVTKEYDRMSLGDLLVPLPSFPLRPGQEAQPVATGGEAMVMGFAGVAELRDLGAIAFLDQGADHGVSIGDEYEYVNTLAGRDQVEGRLQVVGVKAGTASARITHMDDMVFRQGIVVRLARKMR